MPDMMKLKTVLASGTADTIHHFVFNDLARNLVSVFTKSDWQLQQQFVNYLQKT